MQLQPRSGEGDDIRAQAAEWLISKEVGQQDSKAPDEKAPDEKAFDEKAFDEWLKQDARHAAAYEEARRVWGMATQMRVVALPKVRRNPWRPALGLALTAALAAIAVFGLNWQRSDLLQSLTADYAALQGKPRSFDLPDGSRVTLDAGSAIDYADDRDSRQVTLLAGAGYFDVAHDGRSFRVSSGRDNVRALGTRFEVRRDDDITTVTLAQGVVEVEAPQMQPKRLVPGQQLRLEGAGPAHVAEVDPSEMLDWLGGSFAFYDLPLSELCALLTRHGAGPIVIADGKRAHERLSGRLRLDQPVIELDALASALGLSVRNLAGTKILM